MAQAPVGADLGEPFDVLRSVAPQVTLDLQRLDLVAELDLLVLGQILDVGVGSMPIFASTS